MMSVREKSTSDDNGELVERFALTMQNLGLNRAADELAKMLKSARWRRFVQGFQTFEFLPGEFDYFLTLQGITRDAVMAIPDVKIKAKLEEAMDERKTGEPGYRRPIIQARAEIPQIPGRQIEPFGLTKSEAKVLVTGRGDARPPLGASVRRWRNTHGVTTRKPNELRPMWERLAASAVRLDDQDLEQLYERLQAERQQRRRQQRKKTR